MISIVRTLYGCEDWLGSAEGPDMASNSQRKDQRIDLPVGLGGPAGVPAR